MSETDVDKVEPEESDEIPVSDGKQPIDPDLLIPAVGAMIFASDEPGPPKELAAAMRGVKLDEVETAIEGLDQSLAAAGVGLELERVAGGYRLATRSEVGPWVRRFFQQRNRTRLSPAALETLAIVAYRQPVTAPEIQAIRGKDPTPVLKNLLDKKMIRILGKKKVVGNPLLYGTRKQFLVHFGLNSLDDLPSIDDFDEFLGALDSEQGHLFRGDPEGAEAHPDPDEALASGAAAGPEAAEDAPEEGDPLAEFPDDEESH